MIRLEGRADGIISRVENGKERITVDEIKGVLRDLEYIERPVGVHLPRQNVMRTSMPYRIILMRSVSR